MTITLRINRWYYYVSDFGDQDVIHEIQEKSRTHVDTVIGNDKYLLFSKYQT